ncbi:hypothetical protein J5N97_020180 [Dioscorea zingiberensis]|uniref:Uncharacterized protein n=1 Tax=Dioscorea zingiberensis TaxID=325984 RepID=A0A9D5CFD3_9LILI|nr:hypothetical protein J5N97_020180 [Dioscorea zingiberensis]
MLVPAREDGGGAEDEGYLVAYMHDEKNDESMFVVMGARLQEMEVMAKDTHHSPQAEPSQAGNAVGSRVKKKRTEAVNTNVAASRNNASHQVDEDPPTSHIPASSIATSHQVDAPPSTNAANLSDKEKRKTKAAWSSDSSVSIFRDAHTGAAIVGRAVSHYTPFMTANELECILTKRREARMKARREELGEQPSVSMECPELLTQQSRIDTATDTNSGQFDLM